MKRKIFAISLLLSASSLAGAVETAVGVSLSSFGAGAQVTWGINDNLGVRGHFSAAEFDESTEADGVDYDAELEVGAIGVILDYYPMGGNFRLSAGLFDNQNELTGTATVAAEGIGDGTATYTGQMDIDVDLGDVVPYVGLGWGNAAGDGMPVRFGVDVGLVPMDPDVELTLQQPAPGVTQADIDAEEKNVEDDLDEFELYPFINLSLSYRF